MMSGSPSLALKLGKDFAHDAVMPVLRKRRDEIGIVEQGQRPSTIIVLLGDKLAGGLQFLEQRTDNTVGPDAEAWYPVPENEYCP